jgi:hypothetical protein
MCSFQRRRRDKRSLRRPANTTTASPPHPLDIRQHPALAQPTAETPRRGRDPSGSCSGRRRRRQRFSDTALGGCDQTTTVRAGAGGAKTGRTGDAAAEILDGGGEGALFRGGGGGAAADADGVCCG